MKKLVLFFIALLSAGGLFAQTDCADLIISEYVEGWNNNKSLELYNPTGSPIVLDNVYRLIRWSNGATNSNEDMQYVLPLPGTIEPYKVMVMIQDTTDPSQDTMVWAGLRKKATWLAPFAYSTTPPTQGGNVVFWNGDDAVSLQKKVNGVWTDIDIFGEIGVKPQAGGTGTLGAWTDTKPYWTGVGKYLTMNHTLVRKHTVKHGVNRQTMIHYGDSLTGGKPNSFNTFLEYDSMPANYFDELGQHWCDCNVNYPVPGFQGDSTSLKVGGKVTFTNVSQGTPVSYLWTFTGGSPASSTLKTPPAVVYNSLGKFDVSLTVVNEFGTNTMNKKGYIVVGNLGVNETKNKNNIVVLPNPVTNSQFAIKSDLPVESVEVVSIVGQSVYFHDFGSHQKDVRVLMNNALPGIYLVKVKFNDDQMVTRKIIVQ